jgi:hypothetical protein
MRTVSDNAIDRLTQERDAWKALAEVRQELLACYKLSKKPSEALWDRMDAALLELHHLGFRP